VAALGLGVGWCIRLTISLLSVSRIYRQRGTLNVSQPHRHPWPVTGIALLIYLIHLFFYISMIKYSILLTHELWQTDRFIKLEVTTLPLLDVLAWCRM
jgi:hypothetical protein